MSRIASVALLGKQRFDAKMIDDVSLIQPIYLKPPHISQPKSKTY
jgi:hypothetical protein